MAKRPIFLPYSEGHRLVKEVMIEFVWHPGMAPTQKMKNVVALHEAGVAAEDPAYQRGVEFLLNTQLSDGSWFVKTRSAPIQPYFESDFPHGDDQWISVAATNWATMALIHTR